jgi:hypothetical protein
LPKIGRIWLARVPALKQADRPADDDGPLWAGLETPVSGTRERVPGVIDNQDQPGFELHADGRLAGLGCRRRERRLVLIHSEVPSEREGRGVVPEGK